MSSDIDEDCDLYDAPRGGVHPVGGQGGMAGGQEAWPESPTNMIHSYVNIVDRSEEEEKPALPARRDRPRVKPPTQRKSRSKDREKEGEYEKIKEREKELERIHRRSRELMLRMGSGSRDNSLDRNGGRRAVEHHYRMTAGNGMPVPSVSSGHHHHHLPPHFSHPPPPRHPPPPLPTAMQPQNRYKSPSPASHELTSRAAAAAAASNSLRRRVQSPNRRDFKDFSSHRDFRSPNRRLTDDEEDSGADSMNDMVSSHSCRSPHHMALVPYEPRHGCRSCYAGCGGGGHYCPTCMYLPQNMQIALPPSIEERLLALEGDKDQLHLQVAVLSDQIESQTEKITDLERILDDKKEVLKKTEELLQREMLNRSSLETQKLELMSEISGLKLKQTSTERENLELRKRLQRTLQLSEGSYEGSRSLPRRPAHREVDPLPIPPGVFRPFNLELSREREKEHCNEKETTPSRGATNGFFTRSNSVRHSSVPSSMVIRVREKSRDRGRNEPTGQSEQNACSQNPIATKPKGLKKILSRMRRSNSGHIPQEVKKETEKQDFRASAGSKILDGWEGHRCSTSSFQPSLPFNQWDPDTLCSWFDNIGLYMYSNDVRRTVKDGLHLASLSSSDLEARLGMKHPLHRKKVLLAVAARQQDADDPAGRLDHQWVTRWLDDVGLPQYKDAFLEARIDARVLNYLTVDDLFLLKVTNQLHHLSIKWGIEVLRSCNYDPACLKRRSIPGERESQIVHAEVIFWTNHRVMEWLRHVDLSEYAPNLRGSGVHGALMVQEKKFTAELMASLLSIPSSKTLLRRHLSLHFRDLVGPDVVQEKRLAETEPDYQPLTPSARAKPSKKGQFTLKRKKSKAEVDFEDMICPLQHLPN